jgi:HAD superfamily hydrolase (TIGR01509 family)
LFDLDGTLLDTNYLHTLAWWRALDDAGARRTMAEIHRLIGMGSDELLTTLLGHPARDVSASHGHYFKELHRFISPLPGASELVSEVKRHGGIAVVVTSAKKDDLPALFGALEVEECFDLVIGGEDADRAKPQPDLFATALDRIALPPTSALALGDAVWDVEAAGRAGVDCIAVGSGGFCENELVSAGALAVYESCADLLARWITSPLANFFDP